MSSKTLTKPKMPVNVGPREVLMLPTSTFSEPALSQRALKLVDTLGIAASSLCAIHCAAMPLVIGILPLLGLQVLEGPLAHRVLAFFVSIFCTGIIPGFLRHRKMIVLKIMLPGLLLVLFATFGAPNYLSESWEVPLISLGNLLVISAHWLNRRLLSCSANCH
jgi:hypothetical protein